MSDEAVFDLGEIDAEYQRSPRSAARPARSEPGRRSIQRPGADAGWDGLAEAGAMGIALVLPGAGQLLRAQFARGLFFLAWIGFLATLGWALLDTLDRLGPTLDLLGLPAEGGVWALGALFLIAAVLHVTSAVGSVPEVASPGPVTAGVASGRHSRLRRKLRLTTKSRYCSRSTGSRRSASAAATSPPSVSG